MEEIIWYGKTREMQFSLLQQVCKKGQLGRERERERIDYKLRPKRGAPHSFTGSYQTLASHCAYTYPPDKNFIHRLHI